LDLCQIVITYIIIRNGILFQRNVIGLNHICRVMRLFGVEKKYIFDFPLLQTYLWHNNITSCTSMYGLTMKSYSTSIDRRDQNHKKTCHLISKMLMEAPGYDRNEDHYVNCNVSTLIVPGVLIPAILWDAISYFM